MTSAESGAGRSRCRRRAVAPPTSGRTAAEEAQFETSGTTADTEPATDDSPGNGRPSVRAAGRDAEASALSARDRWILDQRPPHWS